MAPRRRGEASTAVTASLLTREPAVMIGLDEHVDQLLDLMAQRRMWLLPVPGERGLVGVIHYAIGAAKLSPRASLNRSRHVIPHSDVIPRVQILW